MYARIRVWRGRRQKCVTYCEIRERGKLRAKQKCNQLTQCQLISHDLGGSRLNKQARCRWKSALFTIGTVHRGGEESGLSNAVAQMHEAGDGKEERSCRFRWLQARSDAGRMQFEKRARRRTRDSLGNYKLIEETFERVGRRSELQPDQCEMNLADLHVHNEMIER